METHKFFFITTKATAYIMFLSLIVILSAISATSTRILDEQSIPVVPTQSSNPVLTPAANAAFSLPIQPTPSVAAITSATHADHTLTFFMHDILGGSKPSALAVTGIVNNPAASGQIPFAKPNGANLPLNSGVSQDNGNSGLINNDNIPFLTGLSGTTQNFLQNNGNNFFNNGMNVPVSSGGQLPSGSILQKLMFGTMTVIDDELTEGNELGSGFVGKAQGFYVVSSIDGSSQTMVFTAMFESGNYVDSLSFFGVHRTATSESQLAIMGGTGKYVNAKGFVVVKTIPETNQHETDGVETLLEFTVYVSY